MAKNTSLKTIYCILFLGISFLVIPDMVFADCPQEEVFDSYNCTYTCQAGFCPLTPVFTSCAYRAMWAPSPPSNCGVSPFDCATCNQPFTGGDSCHTYGNYVLAQCLEVSYAHLERIYGILKDNWRPECGHCIDCAYLDNCSSPKVSHQETCSCDCPNPQELAGCGDLPDKCYFILNNNQCTCLCPGKNPVEDNDIISDFSISANGGKVYSLNSGFRNTCVGGSFDGLYCYNACDDGNNYCQDTGLVYVDTLDFNQPIKFLFGADKDKYREVWLWVWETSPTYEITGLETSFHFFSSPNGSGVPSEVVLSDTFRNQMKDGYSYWFYVELHDCNCDSENIFVYKWVVFKGLKTGCNVSPIDYTKVNDFWAMAQLVFPFSLLTWVNNFLDFEVDPDNFLSLYIPVVGDIEITPLDLSGIRIVILALIVFELARFLKRRLL